MYRFGILEVIISFLLFETVHASSDYNNSSSESLDFPKIELSKPLFYTNHSSEKLSNDSYILPITINTLEFNCTSKYPTRWSFEIPPHKDEHLKDFSITKYRTIEYFNDSSTYTYTSTLQLNFKDPSKVPTFFCREKSKTNNYTAKVTSHTSNDDFMIIVNITTGFASELITHNETRFGINRYCNVTMQLNRIKQTVHCGKESTPRFINCKNPDECNSVLVRDDDPKRKELANCTNVTFYDTCEHYKCAQLSPSNSPGVIICIDKYGNSIARRYLITQTPNKTRHFHLGRDQDYDNETIFISYKSTTENIFFNQSVIFTCTGTGAYYSYGFQWGIYSANESGITYDPSDTENLDQHLQVYKASKRFTFKEEMGNNITVLCFGPRWNFATWANTSINLEIKKPIQPKIIFTNHECDCENKGCKNTTFVCKSSGAPIPIIKWILEIGNNSQQLIENTKNDSLHIITKSVKGNNIISRVTVKFALDKNTTIKCVAESYVGSAPYTFVNECEEEIKAVPWTTIALIIVSILFVLFVVGGIYFLRRYRKQFQMLSEEEIREFEQGDPHSENALLLPYNMDYEVCAEDVRSDNLIIGEGQFGLVLIGTYKSEQVAIKTMKPSAEKGYFKALLSEIKVMCYVGPHPNLVNLIGAYTKNIRKKEVFLLTEFCKNGSLKKFLRNSRGCCIDLFQSSKYQRERQAQLGETNLHKANSSPSINCISTKHLLQWAYECAVAMEYLSRKKVIHGDLAARNVLLTESLTAKLGDFGLSKQLYEYSIYVQKLDCPLPLKWMAPESLQDLEFSIQSDVWSFGIVVWEILSLGQVPYQDIPQWNFQSYKLLKDGHRMEKPPFSNDNIYRIMRACWDINPHSRPSFNSLKEFFEQELLSLVKHSEASPNLNYINQEKRVSKETSL